MTNPTTDPAVVPAPFVLWLDASDGSVPTHDGVRWPDGTVTIHHRHFGLTTTHHDPEAACRAAHGKQSRIVWSDAVLAVLPSRAAVLHEAADIGEDVANRIHASGDDHRAGGAYDVVDELRRRMAGEEQQPEESEPAVTMHAIPLPGSNGISACCGRPPCEFVGERVTRDPDKVTCSGPAARVRQDGAQP
ncbi:hypothetical protein [Streptomyces scabiei]|uniref:hypothetical protein n=1 Tax=Streptomyces scabiei TaxID=1930 RepID=UPI0029BC121C|nr:hypothetical protein [Streptomyces scabiei]MDX3520749.1 hypothetical protein [Streptomyces scabiei]